MSEPLIGDVTDTALWVATYRAIESKRPDALFQDPYAEKLAGNKGFVIAQKQFGSRYTAWSVVMRTVIIDRLINNLIAEKKIDNILNLGTGLDSRPYRMNLPADLKWIEVDFPKIIEHKEAVLKNETPKCQLQRVKLDLSNRELRKNFFAEVSKQSDKILIITEGVIPYLSNESVAELAQDLHQHNSFKFWITEYFSPRVMKYLMSNKRKKAMKNAPFLFNPPEWISFFEKNGWVSEQMQFVSEEGFKLGRMPDLSFWMKLRVLFTTQKQREAFRKMSGYALMIQK